MSYFVDLFHRGLKGKSSSSSSPIEELRDLKAPEESYRPTLPYNVGPVIKNLIEAGATHPETHAFGPEAIPLISNFPNNLTVEAYAPKASAEVISDRIKTIINFSERILDVPQVDGVLLYGSSLWKNSPGDVDLMVITSLDTDRYGDYHVIGFTPTEVKVEKSLSALLNKPINSVAIELGGREIETDLRVVSQFQAYGWGAVIATSGPFLIISKADDELRFFGSVANTKAIEARTYLPREP